MSSPGGGLLSTILSQVGIPVSPNMLRAQGNEISIELTEADVKNILLNYVAPERRDLVARYIDVRLEQGRLRVVVRL